MMKRNLKKLITSLFLATLTLMFCVASETGAFSFVEGCKAFSKGDWENSVFMLKKAVAYKEYETPDAYYMLITAEVELNDNKTALDDCEFFLKQFPDSIYKSRVTYLKGKILFNLKEYEKAIVVLSDFCHQNEDDDMYSYALFYIAESLYENYQYDEAQVIYERIVQDFSESPKAPLSQFRVESILQREREEKLLYLLKQTGEEYLAAKEDYERQLKMYNSDAVLSSREKLIETQQHNVELNERVSDLERQIALLQAQLAREQEKQNSASNQNVKNSDEDDFSGEDIPSMEPYDEKKERVKALKQKAKEVQSLMDKEN